MKGEVVTFEVKRIAVSDLYDLCVRKRYYTAGSNSAYTDMFQTFCGRDLSNADLIRLAENIRSHSEHGCFSGILDEVRGIAITLNKEVTV